MTTPISVINRLNAEKNRLSSPYPFLYCIKLYTGMETLSYYQALKDDIRILEADTGASTSAIQTQISALKSKLDITPIGEELPSKRYAYFVNNTVDVYCGSRPATATDLEDHDTIFTTDSHILGAPVRQRYSASNFNVAPPSYNTYGEGPTWAITMFNDGTYQKYFDDFQGMAGHSIQLIAGMPSSLSMVDIHLQPKRIVVMDYNEEEQVFDLEVLNTQVNSASITITAGLPNLTIMKFPKFKYVKRYCIWKFKSPECGYTGAESVCNHTLENCKRLANRINYGGKPFINNVR